MVGALSLAETMSGAQLSIWGPSGGVTETVVVLGGQRLALLISPQVFPHRMLLCVCVCVLGRGGGPHFPLMRPIRANSQEA